MRCSGKGATGGALGEGHNKSRPLGVEFQGYNSMIGPIRRADTHSGVHERQETAKNPDYNQMSNRAYYCRATGRVEEAKRLEQARRAIPANDPHDPDYRRLYYVRYGDDFLLGFTGPRCEAEMIRDRLKTFLAQKLSLELSEAKTLITHANTQKARFLGYDISVTQCNTKIGGKRRSVNGGIALRMPGSFVAERSRFYMRDGKAIHRRNGLTARITASYASTKPSTGAS